MAAAPDSRHRLQRPVSQRTTAADRRAWTRALEIVVERERPVLEALAASDRGGLQGAGGGPPEADQPPPRRGR